MDVVFERHDQLGCKERFLSGRHTARCGTIFLFKWESAKRIRSHPEKKTSTDLYSALTEILTTPNIHLEVIWTKFMEVLAVNDKESSGNHWGSNTYTHYYFVFNCAFTLAICYRIGTVGSFFLRAFSSAGSNSHLNTRFQSKPPRSSVEAAIYWKLSIAITSITGQTILVRSYGRY